MEKLTVKIGIGQLEKPMTYAQALRYGKAEMPADLRKAGFVCTVFRSNADIHGGDWFRINYSK